MSEEQRKDLKLKLALGVIVLVFGGGALLLGPFLPKVLEVTLEKKGEPGSAARVYYIGRIMEWTFRREEAQKVYEQYWLYYGDENTGDYDWDRVFPESPYRDQPYFMPWIAMGMEERPDPVRTGEEEREYLGKVLMAHAKYYWDKRLYDQADHMYACLAALWPEGSEAQRDGALGVERKKGRTF